MVPGLFAEKPDKPRTHSTGLLLPVVVGIMAETTRVGSLLIREATQRKRIRLFVFWNLVKVSVLFTLLRST